MNESLNFQEASIPFTGPLTCMVLLFQSLAGENPRISIRLAHDEKSRSIHLPKSRWSIDVCWMDEVMDEGINLQHKLVLLLSKWRSVKSVPPHTYGHACSPSSLHWCLKSSGGKITNSYTVARDLRLWCPSVFRFPLPPALTWLLETPALLFVTLYLSCGQKEEAKPFCRHQPGAPRFRSQQRMSDQHLCF